MRLAVLAPGPEVLFPRAPLQAALVRVAEVRARLRKVTASLGSMGAGDMLVAVGQLATVWETHTQSPAATDRGAGLVSGAVAGATYGADGDFGTGSARDGAGMIAAEEGRVGEIGVVWALGGSTGEMGLADAELAVAGTGAVPTAVVRA